MDPCRHIRHEVVEALLERKALILREAEEGGRLLQEEARHAESDAAEEAAFAKWNRYRREVLFAAHAQAQKIDLQVYEIIRAPCSEVVKKAQELGVQERPEVHEEDSDTAGAAAVMPVGEPEPVEDESARPAGEERSLEAGPLLEPPGPPPETEATEPESFRPGEEPDSEVAEVFGPDPEVLEIPGMPDADPLAEAVAPEEAAPPPVPEASEEQPAAVSDGQEPWDQVTEEEQPFPPETAEDLRDLESEVVEEVEELDVADDAGASAADAIATPAEDIPAPPAEVSPEAIDAPRDAPQAQEMEPPEVAVPSEPSVEEPEEEVAPADAELAATGEPGVAETDRPEESSALGAPEVDQLSPEPVAAEVEGAGIPLAIDAERTRRRLPTWLVGLLSGLAGAVVTTVVVVLLLNNGIGRRASQTPATPPPPTEISATPDHTAAPSTAVAAVLATDTATTQPSPTGTPTPSPTKPATPTPVPQPTNTSTPSATPSPVPTATSIPSRTPVPTSTSTKAPTSTATPSTPQVLVDGTYNVRTGPAINYPVLNQVRADQTYEIVGQNSAGTWWQICCFQGASGWILASLAPSEGPAESVDVVTDIPPTPEPTPEVESVANEVPESLAGRFVFPVFDADEQAYDIYTANADGSDLQWLLADASQPALSPDGQRIAFRHWWDGGRGIAVSDADGGNVQRYSNFLEDGLPAWAPDDRSLLFTSRRESDRQSRIYRVDLISSNETQITSGTTAVIGQAANLLPDGSIVYKATWPQAGLVLMNASGVGEQLLVADPSAAGPVGSPDGSAIAYMSAQDGNWEIYRVSRDGSEIQRLTESPGNDGLPAWSPDGQIIAFVSDRDGVWGMWAMTADGQGQRQLFPLPGPPDGRVRGEDPTYSSLGWIEERVSWGP